MSESFLSENPEEIEIIFDDLSDLPKEVFSNSLTVLTVGIDVENSHESKESKLEDFL